MPRLFTALEVPPIIGMKLSTLRGGLPGARWIDVENYHITLSFIGDIDDGLARDVAEALDGVRRPIVDIVVDGLDAFGGSRPKSVHARVLPNPALMELQAVQERLLRRLGVPIENRQYTPHITLARLRSEATARLTADWLALRGGGRLSFTAERFVLYSSRDSVGGGPYIVEEAYELQRREEPAMR
ncbi:RNA 2',3'-cyclic phosphodiesterase [Labrys sp. LIt4]|uniref:RNA 2',3'-cyclic phosphodiesterase n=1 Tax=Labrys okinawensis TaxID=346911 RepID=A0A2S9QHQ6_9HYPH|nr:MULTISPECIES: RNA 2',3'-cyclic phosphodiesterase [Labrys]MBP0582509.1 RNA 2',3'-cyclic phosphodiesterase [Labrys sp. LIt4]PRH88897.1 RNA 2',3'-cyclic phosphodiesterase [Labrys okinawensis]